MFEQFACHLKQTFSVSMPPSQMQNMHSTADTSNHSQICLMLSNHMFLTAFQSFSDILMATV